MSDRSTPRAALRHALLAGLSAAALAGLTAGAWAQAPITVAGEKMFPESITATADGTVFVGGVASGNLYKAIPGATTADVWLTKEQAGTNMVLGVLADEQSGTLWACSSMFGPDSPPATMKAFDLATGAAKGSYAMGAGSAVCNDMVVAADGTVYATSTSDGKIYRLAPGGSALEEWLAGDERLAGGLDGIAFGGDGRLYVNNVGKGTLFAIPVEADGKAGPVVEIALAEPMKGPDGMRAAPDGTLWVAENQAGRISHIVVTGDTAVVTTIKDGFDASVGVTQVGNTLWVVEAKFRFMMGPAAGQDPGPFVLTPVPAPM